MATSTTKMTKLDKLQELKLDVMPLSYRCPAVSSTSYASLLLIQNHVQKNSKKKLKYWQWLV